MALPLGKRKEKDMVKWKKAFTFSFLFIILASSSVFALDVPKLKARVNDYANILTDPEEKQLEKKVEQHDLETSNQLAVLTINSLEGESLEEYSLKVAETWGVGQKEKDNGVLILISKDDRKIRIETGYGVEGALPDGMCGLIISNEMTPKFKQGNYYAGVDAAIDKIILAIKGEYNPEPKKSSGETDAGGILIMYGIVMLIAGFFGIIHPIIGGIIGGVGFFLITKLTFSPSGGVLLLVTIIGFLMGGIAKFILEAMAESGGGYSSGGGWSSGSSSSSDSGFGGFGGGSFGGGGASGGW